MRALHLLAGALGALALGGCEIWDRLPYNGSNTLDALPWDPEVVSRTDGVYVRLPAGGALARVTPEGWETVDLDGMSPTRLVAAPDGQTLLVFGSYPVCDDPDPKILTAQDCEDAEGELSEVYELALVRDGARVQAVEVPPYFNAVAFSTDGQTAVAYLDYDAGADIIVEGVADLTQVLFMDIPSGDTTAVPVGFAADRVLFNADDTRAVVLSRSQVVVVELETGEYSQVVAFPLSLDVDDQVQPEDIALTPDGTYALITVRGQEDLYVLDLEQESINIVSLAGVPADLLVDTPTDRSVVVYATRPQADLLEHQYFEIEEAPLDEACTAALALGDGQALLYNTNAGTHDVYRVDLLTGETIEYRLENPAMSLDLAPGGLYAVALTRPEATGSAGLEAWYDQAYGLEVLGLEGDGSLPLVAESMPVGLAFGGEETSPQAMVLLEGVADLLRVDLASGTATAVELVDAPLGLYTFGEGFVVTHDAALGLLSFLDAQGELLATAGGFGAVGLMDSETELPRRGEEE